MTSQFRSLLLLFSMLLLLPSMQAEDSKAASVNPALAAADQLYTAGKFAEAADSYQAILKSDPKLAVAQAGLIRCWLHEQRVDDAQAAATSALAADPNSAPLLAAMGDVDFRRAQMPEAEAAYRKALQNDPQQVRAYLGLARLYRVYSLYGHAYGVLQRAHELAPDNPEVQRAWFNQLHGKERIAAIESYLAEPHPDNPEETASLKRYLDFLKAIGDKPVHACRMVNSLEHTDTKLEAMRSDPTHIFGYGLTVRMNGHDGRLQLDTGAGGIIVGRKFAEKAKLTRISEERYVGIGNKGEQGGYTAMAETIRVGELEFQNCVVHVTDRGSIVDEDGLIGGNVFASYLIDIDIPDQKLRLSPLPKRPDGPETTPALKTEEEQGVSEERSEGQPDQAPEETNSGKSASTPAVRRLPMDRYVAPEMAKWTPVFRFGHSLLIPTHVNGSPSMLFMIDTGANVNMLSQRAAKQVTTISLDPTSHVKGLSGDVDNVYRACRATLVFGHLAQKNQDMVTFDLTNMSRHLGTEVSGLLGFDTLHMLQVKIDYRDGLVDFVYDASRWH